MRNRDPLLIKGIFEGIASRYDLLNDLLSFGLHRFWKKKLLSILSPVPGGRWLDLCCGTGDVALQLSTYLQLNGEVIGIDSAFKPLQIANLKSFKRRSLNIRWLQRDAVKTELPSSQFDGVVMAYGLRNLVDISEGLEEVYRLLKPGSKAGFLDFIALL